MNLATLVSPDAVAGLESVSSKKRSLEQLAALLVDVNPQLKPEGVFDALMERERLGSTALGKGVAIPHARLPGVDRPSIAIIKMDKGIDFDAPDGLPVDVLVALVVPDEANEEHLQILASLAELASDEDFLAGFRARQGGAALYDYLIQYLDQPAAGPAVGAVQAPPGAAAGHSSA